MNFENSKTSVFSNDLMELFEFKLETDSISFLPSPKAQESSLELNMVLKNQSSAKESVRAASVNLQTRDSLEESFHFGNEVPIHLGDVYLACIQQQHRPTNESSSTAYTSPPASSELESFYHSPDLELEPIRVPSSSSFKKTFVDHGKRKSPGAVKSVSFADDSKEIAIDSKTFAQTEDSVDKPKLSRIFTKLFNKGGEKSPSNKQKKLLSADHLLLSPDVSPSLNTSFSQSLPHTLSSPPFSGIGGSVLVKDEELLPRSPSYSTHNSPLSSFEIQTDPSLRTQLLQTSVVLTNTQCAQTDPLIEEIKPLVMATCCQTIDDTHRQELAVETSCQTENVAIYDAQHLMNRQDSDSLTRSSNVYHSHGSLTVSSEETLSESERQQEEINYLHEENIRLLQELNLMKLTVSTERSRTQQMLILKEAAEARFEKLARVAHRKLLRAMDGY